ncbi:MAG: hypothetical protein AAFX51_01900 [Cyanobacteria bacterium J06636_28]
MAGRRRKGRASVGLLFGANPFDELAVAVDEPDTVREALGRELSTGGPAALERWGPIQAVLERRPEERWWLALMSRCGGQPHADDHALRSAAQASAHPGVLGAPKPPLAVVASPVPTWGQGRKVLPPPVPTGGRNR